jgi:hypothetical protein
MGKVRTREIKYFIGIYYKPIVVLGNKIGYCKKLYNKGKLLLLAMIYIYIFNIYFCLRTFDMSIFNSQRCFLFSNSGVIFNLRVTNF